MQAYGLDGTKRTVWLNGQEVGHLCNWFWGSSEPGRTVLGIVRLFKHKYDGIIVPSHDEHDDPYIRTGFYIGLVRWQLKEESDV